MARFFKPGPLICVSAFALAAFTVPSFARDADQTARNEVRQQVVEFRDLNLDSTYGADQLLLRINNAAGKVCGARSGPQPLEERRNSRDCAGLAEEQAIYDVGHPLVIARYYGRTPQIIIAENDRDAQRYDHGSVVVYKMR